MHPKVKDGWTLEHKLIGSVESSLPNRLRGGSWWSGSYDNGGGANHGLATAHDSGSDGGAAQYRCERPQPGSQLRFVPMRELR
jgi:hypothetical protein